MPHQQQQNTAIENMGNDKYSQAIEIDGTVLPPKYPYRTISCELISYMIATASISYTKYGKPPQTPSITEWEKKLFEHAVMAKLTCYIRIKKPTTLKPFCIRLDFLY